MKNRYSFTKLDNAVLEDNQLSRIARAVFVVLSKHSKLVNDSRLCFLHISTIAAEAKYAPRSVRYALRELVDLGIIQRRYQFTTDGHNKASLFVVIGAHALRYADVVETHALQATGTYDSQAQISNSSYPAKNAPYPANNAAYNYTSVNNTFIDSINRDSLVPLSCSCSQDSCSNQKTQNPMLISAPNVLEACYDSFNLDNSCEHESVHETLNSTSKDSVSVHESFTQRDFFTQEEKQKMLEEKYCYNIDQAPEAFHTVIENILLLTGRAPAKLSEDELNALQALNAKHTPKRVLNEYYKVAARFERNGKPLNTITFCYIEAALRNQPSTIPSKDRKTNSEKSNADKFREAKWSYLNAPIRCYGRRDEDVNNRIAMSELLFLPIKGMMDGNVKFEKDSDGYLCCPPQIMACDLSKAVEKTEQTGYSSMYSEQLLWVAKKSYDDEYITQTLEDVHSLPDTLVEETTPGWNWGDMCWNKDWHDATREAGYRYFRDSHGVYRMEYYKELDKTIDKTKKNYKGKENN